MGGIYATGSPQKRTSVFLLPCASVWKHNLVYTRQCTSGSEQASTGGVRAWSQQFVWEAVSAGGVAGGFLLQRYFTERTQWGAEVGRSFKSTCCTLMWAYLQCSCAGKMQSGRFGEHRASLKRAEHGDWLCIGMGEVSIMFSKLCQHLLR